MQKVNVKSKYMSGSWLLVSSVEELTKYMENTSDFIDFAKENANVTCNF